MPYYCATHSTTPLLWTSQSPAGAPAILTCPECNAAAIDRWAAAPGTIVLEQSEKLDGAIMQTVRVDGVEFVRVVDESE